jgi:RNA polymerase sigma factor (sigma-70 family)
VTVPERGGWGVTVADSRSDAELLGVVGDGELSAMRVLYDRHAPWLAVRLTRRCNDPEVVADVLQDSFVAVWRQAGSFRGDGEVGAWLWGIAVRRLVSRLRRRRDVVVFADVPPQGRAQPGVEEQVLLDVEYGDLGAALARLSPEMRAVMQATVLDGLSMRETAALLHIPPNTVKTRLHRAKAQLRAGLAEGRP